MINPEFVEIPTLKYFKENENVPVIKFGTLEAACFDLSASFGYESKIVAYNKNNGMKLIDVFPGVNEYPTIQMESEDRLLIPTGLYFDIPKGWSIRVHPRSGLSVKSGLNLANCEGVIDSDYVDEVKITLVNNTKQTQYIVTGDRLAQAELVPVYKFNTQILGTKPQPKGNRIGGFGSTGR